MTQTFVRLFVLSAIALSAEAAEDWQKFIAPDKAFSFHYPVGWTAKMQDSAVVMRNSKTDEDLLFFALPRGRNARAVAEYFMGELRKTNPDLTASDWNEQNTGAGELAAFQMSFSNDSGKQSALGIVLQDAGQARWLSYSSPASRFEKAKAAKLLGQVLVSVAPGTGSRPPGEATQPTTAIPGVSTTAQIERNLRAFLFVVEFGLGTPFSVAQETLLLKELQEAMSKRPPEELRQFDAYPEAVQVICRAKAEEVGKLQEAIGANIRAGLNQVGDSNSSLAAIRSQLEKSRTVLVNEDVPLTETTASAFSEVTAFCRLLQTQPDAMPGAIDPKTVADIRQRLLKEWPAWSTEKRKNVVAVPGLWIVVRQVLAAGTGEEREKMRQQLRGFLESKAKNDVQEASHKNQTANKSEEDLASDKLLEQQNLFQSTQMLKTMQFNTFMRSIGHNYSTVYGKQVYGPAY